MQKNILPLLNKIFRPQAIVFYSANNALNKVSFNAGNVVTINWNDRELCQYAEYYYKIDPHFSEVINSSKAIFQTSDILSNSQLERLDFFNSYLRPKECYHALYLCLRSDNKLYGYITISRSKQFAFRRNDLLMAKTMVPHITNALRNAILFSEKNKVAFLFSTLEEVRGEGIIILDSELQPVYFNLSALEFCQNLSNKIGKSDIALQDNYFIPSPIIQECSALRSFVQNKEQFNYHHTNKIIYGNGNGACYTEYFLIRDCSVIPAERYYTIILKRISLNNASIEKEDFHLTNRELDIIRHVSNGLTNQEIADKLSLSKLTVEVHLKNIYKKTAARNRIELAMRLQSTLKYFDNIRN